MTKVLFNGRNGKMGQVLVPAIEEAGYELVENLDAAPDIMVDFTTPDAVFDNIIAALRAGATCIVGTSGWDPIRVEGPSSKFQPVFYAPNFAIGAVMMMRVAAEASRHLPHAEIVEYHHPEKLDMPSGTAIATAAAMQGDVPIRSEREEGILARQEVTLTAEQESLVISHEATSREVYIPGVLLALSRAGSLSPGVTVGLEKLL